MSFGSLKGGTFWTQSPQRDPKRAFRFRVEFGESGPIWYAKKADKPTVSFTEASHNYLNHTFYWPARAEWNEVSITMVDPVSPDLAGNLVDSIQAMGYVIPGGTANDIDLASISKKGATAQFGTGDAGTSDDIRIIQIDEDGRDLEKWTLKHAWIKEVTFGDLDYGSEDLTEIVVKFRYDWAEFMSNVEGSDVKGKEIFSVKPI